MSSAVANSYRKSERGSNEAHFQQNNDVVSSHQSSSEPANRAGKSARKVTPNMKHTKTSLDRRMVVDKDIIDELLLVCGVIGTTTNAGNELVPVTDCLNWLQDLQRALRRDEDLYRPVSLLVGKWKVVEQKLLPLVITCRYDTPIVLTVVKILVILTKPLAENTKRAGKMLIDRNSAKKGGADGELLVMQQQKIRDNALEQAQQLMEYKRMVTFHQSHLYHNSNKKKEKVDRKNGTGLLSIFVSLLAEPLSKSGASRTDADHMTIELVLHLIRNLLSAEPLLNTSATTSQQAAQLHQEMISLFERELVLDILLVVGQEMELRENSQYNLLMMEILHHIFKAQDPMAVAQCMTKRRASNKPSDVESVTSPINRSLGNFPSLSSSSMLKSRLKQEQSQRRNLTTARHGHFGGTWMRKQADGRRQFVSASAASQKGGMQTQLRLATQARRKNRLSEPFIGSGKTYLAHTRMPVIDCGPATKRANQTLYKFCQRFMADCYGPFMKTLKNEFRRESVRLEESDKVIFFRLIWFFSQWWRTIPTQRPHSENESDGSKEAVGRLIITMDLYTFNMVLNATDTFTTHKKHTRLAQTVALYSEMMHLLHDMYTSVDKTEHELAMGLIDRLFYGQEALDRIPKLISKWAPGTFSREYLCDLVEVVHVSLKLLEANTKKGIAYVQDNASNSTKKISHGVAKLRATAADFDIKGYLVRKIVSNQMVTMYSHLMTQYKVNANIVNHRIVAMFLRLMSVEIVSPEIADPESPINILGQKRVTLEPILYNIHLIMVMEHILNDNTIRAEKSFESLLKFCTNLMNKFRSAADVNPTLYVECLFRHNMPHRFCELVANMYVSDELRMLAEREILREDQLMLERELEYSAEVLTGSQIQTRNAVDDDDDDEEEFTGDAVVAVMQDSGGIAQERNADEDDSSADEKESSNETNVVGRERDHSMTTVDGKRVTNGHKRQRDAGSSTELASPVEKLARNDVFCESGDSFDEDADFSLSGKHASLAASSLSRADEE